ncbi:hypothetical protein ACFE04_017331 [Oxalis oulophora]
MLALWNLIFFSIILDLLFINSSLCQQVYDKGNCTTWSQELGASYICNSNNDTCETFIVYRAQVNYNSLYSISSLFNLSVKHLLYFNTINESDSNSLASGREVIIPITCSCLDGFSNAVFRYNSSNDSNSFAELSCGIYEGLAKTQSLAEVTSGLESIINVPVRCACPNDNQKINGVKFLSTYPIMSKDNTQIMAQKFGISAEMIWNANKLQPFDTIFPLTTLLIPTMSIPTVKFEFGGSPNIPREAIPVRITTSSVKLDLYVILGVSVLAIASLISGFCICVNIRRKYHPRSFRHLSAISSKGSFGFSPDFLEGVSKLKRSLKIFSQEELEMATENFNQALVIGTAVYLGSIDTSFVAIERMHSDEAARHIINILTRINHLNVVKLKGCSYESAMSYIVYEFAEKGSLRDCLSNSKLLTWKRRMQIAGDVAEALHYIHYSTKPAYVHLNINSRNVLVMGDWRGKITGFRLAKSIICNEKIDNMNWKEPVIVGRKEYFAPEYIAHRQASTKTDVYAFGVVLIEILSGKDVLENAKLLKDSVNCLVDMLIEDSRECLDKKMKEFMDPMLEGKYMLSEAVSMTILAKACIEKDPSKRPTMNDVLKTLSRIV